MAQYHRHWLRPGLGIRLQTGQEGDVRAHGERIAAHAHAVDVGLARVHRRRHGADLGQDAAASGRGDVV